MFWQTLRYKLQDLRHSLSPAEPAHHFMPYLLPLGLAVLALWMLQAPDPASASTSTEEGAPLPDKRTHIEHRFYFDQVKELVQKKFISLSQLQAARKAIETHISSAVAQAEADAEAQVRKSAAPKTSKDALTKAIEAAQDKARALTLADPNVTILPPEPLSSDTEEEKKKKRAAIAAFDLGNILVPDPKDPQATAKRHSAVKEAEIRASRLGRFYTRSPLRGDILAYLRGQPGTAGEQKTFQLNGRGDLIVDASSRRIATPFLERQVWTGRMMFVDRTERKAATPGAVGNVDSRQLRIAVEGQDCFCQELKVHSGRPPLSTKVSRAFEADMLPGYVPLDGIRLNGQATAGAASPGILDAYLGQSGRGLRLYVVPVDSRMVHEHSGSKAGWKREPHGAVTALSIAWPPPEGEAELEYVRSGVPGGTAAPMRFRVYTASEAAGNPYVAHRTDGGARLISYLHFLNGTPLRKRGAGLDSKRATAEQKHALAFVPRLDDAISEMFRSAKTNMTDEEVKQHLTPRIGQDFGVTIDPALQGLIQGALGSGEPTVEYAATVMNERGELLALADRPMPPERGKAAAKDVPFSDASLVNLNFIQHPVGSAGKPMLSAACMVAHPELQAYWVEAQDEEKSNNMLGYKLAKPVETHHAEGQGPDGRTFTHQPPDAAGVKAQMLTSFGVSSDTFFITQLLAALALEAKAADGSPPALTPSQSAGYRYSIGGRIYSHQPLLPGLDEALDPPAFSQGLHDTGFGRNIHDLFGIPLQLDEPGMGDRNLRPFDELVEFSGSLWPTPGTDGEALGRSRARYQLLGISPEHTRLQLLRGVALRDLVFTVVGGGEFGRWSNVDLARSFARLVTARKIETTLVRVLGAEGETTAIQPPEIPELKALQPFMLELLQAPAQQGGTAYGSKDSPKLGMRKPTYDPRDEFVLCAKTGTFPFNDDVTARRGSFSMIEFYLYSRAHGPDGPGVCCVVSLNSNRTWVGNNVGASAHFAAKHILPPLINYLRERLRSL